MSDIFSEEKHPTPIFSASICLRVLRRRVGRGEWKYFLTHTTTDADCDFGGKFTKLIIPAKNDFKKYEFFLAFGILYIHFKINAVVSNVKINAVVPNFKTICICFRRALLPSHIFEHLVLHTPREAPNTPSNYAFLNLQTKVILLSESFQRKSDPFIKYGTPLAHFASSL